MGIFTGFVDHLFGIEKELYLRMTSGELYLTLRKMEAEKIIIGIWQITHKKPWRIYSLTPSGRGILEKAKNVVKESLENLIKKL